MVANKNPTMRPLRLPGAGHSSPGPDRVPQLPERSTKRPVAPDGSNPTLDNGATVPRTDLHIALLAADKDTAELLRNRVRVVKPPYWNGRVHLHIIREDLRKKYATADVQVLQAVVDLGWGNARDLEIGSPEEMTDGYP